MKKYVSDHLSVRDEIILKRGNLYFFRSNRLVPFLNPKREQTVESISIYDGNPQEIGYEAEFIIQINLKQIPSLIAGLKAISGKLKLHE